MTYKEHLHNEKTGHMTRTTMRTVTWQNQRTPKKSFPLQIYMPFTP